MTNAEKKLKALNKCRKDLKPSGRHTSDVKGYVKKIDTAFASYIKSSNVRRDELIEDALTLIVEEHTDFRTAVGCIDKAIQRTEATIQAEKQAKLDAQSK